MAVVEAVEGSTEHHRSVRARPRIGLRLGHGLFIGRHRTTNLRRNREEDIGEAIGRVDCGANL